MHSIESSFKYCENIARNHYENFPVASRLIPADKRKYIFSIYAFARQADDFADEENLGSKEDRLKLLDDWNQKLGGCFENAPVGEPVFIALKRTIEDCNLPIEPLENLLKAFRQDVIKKTYDTFGDVLSYCENSANPVGRLVLMILEEKDESLFQYSDYICTALQLTNFWQDVAVDLKKDRIYIPIEDMNKFGYSIYELSEHLCNNNFKKLMEYEIQRTEELFKKGIYLISMVKRAKELKLITLGGMEILKKIRRNDYDIFRKRSVLNNIDKIKLFAKSNFI